MQSKTLLTVCAALVVFMAIVSGTLWRDLRSARQQIADLQNQRGQEAISIPRSTSVPMPIPPPAIAAPTAPAVAVQLPASSPPSHPVSLPLAVQQAMLASLPERPPGQLTLTRPLVGNGPEERRLEALAQSDLTATARVAAWNSVLRLSPEQLQALNAITVVELRRETEDTIQIYTGTVPKDPVSAAQLRLETANRQHETLLRILEKATPQLTPEQSNMMSAMFADWFEIRTGRIRTEEKYGIQDLRLSR